MLAALKVLVKPFLREHQDATAKIRRQWAYVLKERDGTIEKYAFFYINTVFNLTNCAAILIRLRSPAHGPTDNTNAYATRERYRNALPGDADFEEARRRELVRVRCFFCVACLQAHFSPSRSEATMTRNTIIPVPLPWHGRATATKTRSWLA